MTVAERHAPPGWRMIPTSILGLTLLAVSPPAAHGAGDELAQRCQDLLDDCGRAIIRGRGDWKMFSGAQGRLEKLYDLAAEAAKKLGP
jgi:hypothetical protein